MNQEGRAERGLLTGSGKTQVFNPRQTPHGDSPPRFPATKSTVGSFSLCSHYFLSFILSLPLSLLFSVLPPSLSFLSFLPTSPHSVISFLQSFFQCPKFCQGVEIESAFFLRRNVLNIRAGWVLCPDRLTSGSWSPTGLLLPVWSAGRGGRV